MTLALDLGPDIAVPVRSRSPALPVDVAAHQAQRACGGVGLIGERHGLFDHNPKGSFT